MFILDGYDELEESLRSCRFLEKILSTHDPTLYLSECDVVITTRPVTCRELFTLVTDPHRHVEILGFKIEHIEEYIDKYFKGYDQSVVKKLKDRLRQLPHVRGMCRIPIVLEIVCKVHYLRGDRGIPETQTGIYQEYIIAELIKSTDDEEIFIKDLLTVPEKDFPGFYELCQKAFGCCSTEQRLLLTKQDIGNLIQFEKRGSIYGLLFVEVVDSLHAGGNIRLYHYLHKSIQEMLAAVHIGTLPDSEHASLWEEHLGRVEMGEIWKYYAGITSLKKLETSTLQEMCQKKIGGEDHKMLLIISLFEADNPDVAAKVLPEIFPNGLISIAARSSYEVTALNYCIKHHPTVKGMEFTGPKPFLKFGEPLRDMMRSLHATNSVDSLSFSQLHQKDWKLFYETLPPNSSITCARLGHVPVYIVTDVLLKCDLKKLIIDGMINVTNRKGSAGKVDEELFCRKTAALDWLEFSVTSDFKISDDFPTERLLLYFVKGLINALEITTEDPCIKGDSDAKWKTVKLSLPEMIADQSRTKIFKSVMSIVKVLMKELSSCQNVQHLICIADHGDFIGKPHEYDESWMSSLKQLLVPCLTSQLRLYLSPAEWAAILCGVGDAKDLEKLNLTMWLTAGNTPVDEKELCEAWSQCKCKTVKMEIAYLDGEWTELMKSFVRTLLKGISLCQNVQHLVINCRYNCSSEYDESWMSSLKLLLVPHLTSQLRLYLSPAEWAAILCGVGGAKDLQELDVTMRWTADKTPVDEKELCEAWSQCKCKTVKMKIGYDSGQTLQGVSLLTSVLRGIAQNKTSVEFKLKFDYSGAHSYYMEKIPGDILTHFTRDGKSLTLNPLNSRCPTGSVSSGESPQTPHSNPTGEPSKKRRHIEQPSLVGVTESISSSPVQQVDHASRNVHSTQSDSSRSSPMSQRASLPQSPISSVGVTVDPSSLDTVRIETSRSDMSPSSTHSMGDSPQPPYTLQRTHLIDPQYEIRRPLSLSLSAASQDIFQPMDTRPMTSTRQTDQVVSCSVSPALHPSRDIQMSIPDQNSPSPGTGNQSTLTGPPQRAPPHHLSSEGPPRQSNTPPVPYWPVQPMLAALGCPWDQYSVYSPHGPWGPGANPSQRPGMLQYFPNPQSVQHPQSIYPFPYPQYGHPSLQPIQYNQPPFHPSQPRTGLPSSWGNTVYTPPPPQGPPPTEDLPGPFSLSYPPQYCEPHPPYPSTHYSYPPTLSPPSAVHVAEDVIKSFNWIELRKDIENMLTKPRVDTLERGYNLIDSACNAKIVAQLNSGDPADAAAELLKYFARNHNGDDMLQFCKFLRDEAKEAGRSATLEDLADRIEKTVKDQGSS